MKETSFTSLPAVVEYRRWLVEVHFFTIDASWGAINWIKYYTDMEGDVLEQAVQEVREEYKFYNDSKKINSKTLNVVYSRLLKQKRLKNTSIKEHEIVLKCSYCGFISPTEFENIIHTGICLRLSVDYQYRAKNSQDIIEINKVVKHISLMKRVNVVNDKGITIWKVNDKGNVFYTTDGKEVVFLEHYNEEVRKLYERLK